MIAISFNPIDWVTDAAGAVIGGAGDAVIDAIVGWIEDGLMWIAGAVASQLMDAAAVELSGDTWWELASLTRWLMFAVAVGAMFASVAHAVFSENGSIGDSLREIPLTLAMMAGWVGAVTVWFAFVTTLLGTVSEKATFEALMTGGISLSPDISSFIRAVIALLFVVFLIVLYIELLVINHLLTFGVLIGQVAIALRPIRPLRGVSTEMVRNIVTMSLAPVLAVGSLGLALGNFNDVNGLDLTAALGALAGIAVSVLMPVMVRKFLPLGSSTGSPGRAVIAAGAAAAGAGAAVVATGGLAGAALGPATTGAAGSGAASAAGTAATGGASAVSSAGAGASGRAAPAVAHSVGQLANTDRE